jgi:methylglutaconyl-CoA hydratase
VTVARFVRQAVENAVATVTIDRPDVHNAFDDSVIAELTKAFRELGARGSEVRVAVLASTGPSFSAGADVNWMRRMVDYTLAENLADARAMAEMLRAIRECPKPVIARVHGAVLGGGVGLVAACDVAVALRTATFALTEVRLGILPAVISPYVQERIGAGHLRRYALTAERFDAEEARRIGLVAEIAESAALLDERVASFTRLLEKNGPRAIAACKRVLREVQPVEWERATDVTTQRIAEQRVSPEGQEGLRAFLEKRAPTWSE